MRNVNFIFLFLGLSISLFGQSPAYSEINLKLQNHYNAEEYDKIFGLFSSEMKEVLPLQANQQLWAKFYQDIGLLKSLTFQENDPGDFKIYKAEFERGKLSLQLSLDDQKQINGLLIQPFTESKNTQLINALENYPAEIAETIYQYTQDFPSRTQLSIAVLADGTTKFYGVIIENDSLKPAINQDKVFEIGSVTKVFTSTLLASLVNQGKIKLSQTINQYYPYSFNDSQVISFLELANHTSGLPRLPPNMLFVNPQNPYQNYDEKQLEYFLSKMLKKEQPEYLYSNLGAGLLGHSLGLSQGTSYNELIQQLILDKYGMKHSYFSSESLKDSLVSGLSEAGEPVPNWDFNVLFGAGGLLSTTTDLSLFVAAHFNPDNKELALSLEPTFEVNNELAMALGWHISKSKDKADLYWHNGGTGGYRSSVVFEPKMKKAVIILSNVSGLSPKSQQIDSLCFDLIENI